MQVVQENQHLDTFIKGCVNSALKRTATVGTLTIAALLSACDANNREQLQFSTVSSAESELSLAVPQRLRSASAVDQNALRAVALVNGVETALQKDSSGRFVGQVSVPAQSNVSVSIEFYEEFQGQRLALGKTQKSINTTTDNVMLNVARGDYSYDAFDSDGDGVSNIVERESNTDPFDASHSPDLVTVEVYVERPTSAVSAGYNNYRIEATVGSVTNAASASSGDFRLDYSVATADTINVDVRLVEQVTGQNIIIGTQTRQLTGIQSYQSVRFNASDFILAYDNDSDGVNNLDELIAGTDINQAPAPLPTDTPFTVSFQVPAEITTAPSTYATLAVQGQRIELQLEQGLYTAATSSPVGQEVLIEARIFDTYQGQAVTLATFGAAITPSVNQNLLLDLFDTSIDTDGDGQPNYFELAQGTDPFNAPIAQCTPVTENLNLALSDDAFVLNGLVVDSNRLQVEYEARKSLIRYQYDPSLGAVTAATLSLEVGVDQGDGLVSVYVEPNYEWADTQVLLSNIPSGTLVGSLDGDFDRNNRYDFVLEPSAITEDFTLIISQDSDGNDIGFDSSDVSSGPVLSVTVERCE